MSDYDNCRDEYSDAGTKDAPDQQTKASTAKDALIPSNKGVARPGNG